MGIETQDFGCALKPIVLGTKNKDKLKELKRLLKGSGIEVLGLDAFPACADVVENAKTFEANAKKKAGAYARHTGMLTLADDSGLCVDALRGKPGVYSARFAGLGCNYEDNNRKLLRLLKNVSDKKRGARFVCVIAVYDGKRFVKTVRGECRGRVAHESQGRNGFGYDPVFIPRGFKKTYAELSVAQKNKTSHRGRALRAARRIILKLLRHQALK